MHKQHTHSSAEAERGATAPSHISMRKLVDGLSKPEQRTCAAQGIEVEGTFRDGMKHAAVKPPLLNI